MHISVTRFILFLAWVRGEPALTVDSKWEVSSRNNELRFNNNQDLYGNEVINRDNICTECRNKTTVLRDLGQIFMQGWFRAFVFRVPQGNSELSINLLLWKRLVSRTYTLMLETGKISVQQDPTREKTIEVSLTDPYGRLPVDDTYTVGMTCLDKCPISFTDSEKAYYTKDVSPEVNRNYSFSGRKSGNFSLGAFIDQAIPTESTFTAEAAFTSVFPPDVITSENPSGMNSTPSSENGVPLQLLIPVCCAAAIIVFVIIVLIIICTRRRKRNSAMEMTKKTLPDRHEINKPPELTLQHGNAGYEQMRNTSEPASHAYTDLSENANQEQPGTPSSPHEYSYVQFSGSSSSKPKKPKTKQDTEDGYVNSNDISMASEVVPHAEDSPCIRRSPKPKPIKSPALPTRPEGLLSPTLLSPAGYMRMDGTKSKNFENEDKVITDRSPSPVKISSPVFNDSYMVADDTTTQHSPRPKNAKRSPKAKPQVKTTSPNQQKSEKDSVSKTNVQAMIAKLSQQNDSTNLTDKVPAPKSKAKSPAVDSAGYTIPLPDSNDFNAKVAPPPTQQKGGKKPHSYLEVIG